MPQTLLHDFFRQRIKSEEILQAAKMVEIEPEAGIALMEEVTLAS